MIHQELNITDTIHRFELITNSSASAYEKAFSLYGILIIPALLGANLMYNVFQLRGEYLMITLSMLIIILINVYFYYQKAITKNEELKLIIQNNYIQLMDSKQIYFQEQIQHTKIHLIRCGKDLQPALKLSSEYFQGIIIGLKKTKLETPIETEHQLCQPDYWLLNKHQSQILMTLMDIQNTK